ncbi:MAG TPA: prepilin-type N-terminal cleavage/methylation domain-containing protein [Elusimicrobiota bacterium]|nr:prepilin-type N-terminal cleavage/methylation domain-containing protein [Elusimicrobiota bacterium]
MKRAPIRLIPVAKASARGFTLIEMVVTILILGVLASFGYVQYTKAINNQRLTNATAQAQVIAAADQQYYNDNGSYAPNVNALVTGNYLANQNWSSPFYSYSAGDPSNKCVASAATPNAASVAGVCVDANGKSYTFAAGGSCPVPSTCSQAQVASSSPPPAVAPQNPSPLPPPTTCSPQKSCSAMPVSSIACGNAYSDSCGNSCGVGTSCQSGACTGGICSSGSSSPPPPPPPPPPCTPSCSPTLGCGMTASNGCGGNCTGHYCPVKYACLAKSCVYLGGFGCFVAGTPVLTPAGSVPIEKIKPGDVVYAVDPASYALVPEKVRAVETKTVDTILKVVLSDGIQIEATPIHPFFDPASGRFKQIQYFKAGDRVAFLENSGAAPQDVALAGGDPRLTPALEWDIKIVSIKRMPKKAVVVHNLTMSKPYEDFLVDGVLVHNKPIGYLP